MRNGSFASKLCSQTGPIIQQVKSLGTRDILLLDKRWLRVAKSDEVENSRVSSVGETGVSLQNSIPNQGIGNKNMKVFTSSGILCSLA